MSTKRSAATASPRGKSVPVRIVKNSAPRPRPVSRVVRESSRPTRPGGDRRTLMWVGVISVTAVIFVGWIGFIRSDLSRPGGTDTFWSTLGDEFSTFIRTMKPFQGSNDSGANRNGAVNDGLDDVRQQVFPDLDDQSFTTGNQNANSAVLAP